MYFKTDAFSLFNHCRDQKTEDFCVDNDTCIFNTKVHDSIMKVTHRGSKSSLLSITWVYLDLVTVTEIIHKDEN